MSKILCVTSGLTGITNASLELVSRLKQCGFEISYASCRDVQSKFANLAIDYHQLPAILEDPAPEVPKFSSPGRKIKRLYHKFANLKARQKAADQNIIPSEFLRVISEVKPDLILIDSELNEYIIAAHSTGLPVILLSQWFNHWNGQGLPNIMTDIIPGQGFKGSKLNIWWNWKKTALSRKWTFSKRKFLSAGADRRTTLLRMRERLSFPSVNVGENYWPGPFLFEGLPIISMTAKELEFPYQRKKEFCYAGPMVLSDRSEKLEESTLLRLQEIIQEIKDEKKFLIYVSVSTLQAGDLGFINKIIEASKLIENSEMIISLGGKISNNAFHAIPVHVHLFDFVPQLEVLKHADLSINHGGIHTINECIVAGVPMLVYSGKKSDQNGCAARIDFHKIGIMADKDKDDSKAISSKILNILTSDTFKTKVVDLKEKCAYYKNNKTMEHFINEYIERSTLNEKIESL